jgi:hypothetical protein
MIKTWIVQCDYCCREIDATKEPFYQADNWELCLECYEEDSLGDMPTSKEVEDVDNKESVAGKEHEFRIG